MRYEHQIGVNENDQTDIGQKPDQRENAGDYGHIFDHEQRIEIRAEVEPEWQQQNAQRRNRIEQTVVKFCVILKTLGCVVHIEENQRQLGGDDDDPAYREVEQGGGLEPVLGPAPRRDRLKPPG